jgi:uncharacterized protein involved in response to NO
MGAIGLGAVALGWTQIVWRFVAMLRASPALDRTHARLIAVASTIGALSMWAAAAGIALSDWDLVRSALQAALWLFLGGVYIAVAHRMIPFFSASAVPMLDAWRPLWLLGSFIALLVVEGVPAILDAWRGPLPPLWHGLQAALELPAGLALLALAIRWGLVQSLRIRMLAMLHVGFVWLGLAVVLAGLSHALIAASGGSLSLGVAPLHAYTMGFLGSTLIAMATRVSCGHSGRTLAADDLVWRLYGLLQIAVVARVAAAALAAAQIEGATTLIVVAALAWLGVCAAWALRYGRWYGTPRADGRAG